MFPIQREVSMWDEVQHGSQELGAAAGAALGRRHSDQGSDSSDQESDTEDDADFTDVLGPSRAMIAEALQADRELLASKEATAAQKKAAEIRQKALAKALPAIAAGIRDATKGFQSGDPLGGSAAIMEICTSLTSLMGSLTAVPGPAALVGALFSIISMILKSFAPQQESLSRQLENVLRDMKSEDQVNKLKAAHQGMRTSIAMMMAGSRVWSFGDLMAMLNLTEGDSIKKLRGAAVWLTTSKNQDLELWSQVLAAQCQGYGYFLQAWTYAAAKLNVSANDLQALMAGVKACNADQLKFLREVRTLAANRGRTWALGGYGVDASYPESAGLHVRDVFTGKGKYLGGKHRALAISRVKVKGDEAFDPHPYLAVFGLEQEQDGFTPTFGSRYRKNKRTFGIFGRWPLAKYEGWLELKKLRGLHDIAATPGDNPGEVYIYTANGTTIDRWVHTGKLSKTEGIELKHSDELLFQTYNNFAPKAVCAVSRPRSEHGENRAVLKDETWVVYAGLESGSIYIRAWFSRGSAETFNAPRDGMLGMKVDSTHLWAFGRQYIACITHTAVKAHCNASRGNIGNLNWAFYDIPAELGGDWQAGGNYDGLRDLAPCDDRTLTASFHDTVKPGAGQHLLRIMQTRPRIDWAKQAIVIAGTTTDNFGNSSTTNGWELQSDWIKPSRIYREPVFCWQLTEGLTESLTESQKSLAAGA